jgi:TP901 family phage tail tape measure protein
MALTIAEAFVNLRPKLDQFAQEAKQGLEGIGNTLTSAGSSMTALTAPFAALSGLSIKTAIDFESSFAGIRKTMELTEDEFGRLAAANRNLAQEIPLSVNEINKIGELAGQLGIRGVDNVLLFERTIADLAVTTNLTSEEAALAFAQIANIMQLPQSDIDRLGSTVVDLGNNFATVESKIVDFALRIAGAGAAVGLSTSDVAGIGTAFASLGVEAEAGGTAVQKVLLTMLESVTLGNAKLETFAETAGLSVEEFSTLFREDAASAFLAFVEGLGLQGDQAIRTLNALELKDQRLIRAFLAAAGAGELMRESIELGSEAWAENTALTNEAEQRYATAASQLSLFKNRLQDIGITIGGVLVPAMLESLDRLDPLIALVERGAEAFANADPAIQSVVLAIAGIATAAGPVLITAGMMVKSIGALLPLFAALTSPVALIAAALTGLAVAGYLVYTNWDELTSRYPGLQTALDSVAEGFTGLKDRIVEDVLPVLQRFGEEVAAVLGTVAGIIRDHWSEIESVVGAALNLVGSVLETGMELFRDIVSVGASLIEGDWSGAWEGIKTLTGNLLDNIIDVARAKVDLFISVFTLIWELLPDSVQGALESIYSTASSVLGSVVDAVTSAWETVRDTTVSVWTEISTFLINEVWNSRIGQELRLTLGQWRDWIVEAWEWVSTKTVDAWNGIDGFLSDIWTAEITVELRETLATIREEVGKAWDWVSDKTSTVWDAISGFLSDHWDSIRTVAEAQFGVIRAFFETWLDVTKTVFETVWKAIVVIIGTQLDIIEDIIVGVLKFLRGDIDGAMEEFKGIFGKGWEAVKELTRIGFEGIHAAVLAVWNNLLRPWLADLPGAILSAIGDLAGLLKTAGKSMLDGFATAARDAWANMRTWLNNLPTNIVGAIGNVGSLLFNVGKAIMFSLWDGMKWVWNNHVSGWLSSLGGWITNLKGPIEKDRKLLIPEGAAIMEGLGAGMREGWRDIERLLGGMTMQIPTLAAVTPAPALATTTQSPPPAPAPRTDDRPIVVQLTLDGRVIDERIVRWSEYEQTTGARLAGGR